MRITNWNIERPKIGDPKNPRIVDVIENLQPNIAIFTETNRHVCLNESYRGFHSKPSPRKPEDGEAVAAIWIEQKHFSKVQIWDCHDPTEALCLVTESTWGPVIIYASIIVYHAYKGPDGLSPNWVEHEKAIDWHHRDWLKLREQFPGHSMVAAGDYNQHRDGVGRYGSRKVRTALTRALNDCEMKCVTEQDFVASGKLGRRNVDHICLSKELADAVNSVDAWEGTQAGFLLSDHNGISVDIADA